MKDSSLLQLTFPHLLVVGPLPPPPDGTGVSFQLFCSQVKQYVLEENIRIVDTSPKRLKDENHRYSLVELFQAIRILKPYIRQILWADTILIFGSNGFLLTMTPVLLVLAKIFRKPCYIRSFGGSLDQFYEKLNPLFQALLRSTFSWADGLIVETKLLYTNFTQLVGLRVHYVPGYRPLPATNDSPSPIDFEEQKPLRLVFLGHVNEEKGILVLLESLKQLDESVPVQCDIFGPVYDTFKPRFEAVVAQTTQATYRGVVASKQVNATLRNYDAFVFPTFYRGEGHPGVLIEAMIAGLPMITTAFRSIPELVEDKVNGLLVPPQDAVGLAAAIKLLSNDRQMLAELAQRSWEVRRRFDTNRVIPELLRVINIKTQTPSTLLMEEYS